jgi:DNA-binding MarR family transcriptional regulator
MIRRSDQHVQGAAEGFLIGSLLAILRAHITERVLQAVHQAGFVDLRAAHMLVFMKLPPQGARLTDLAYRGDMTKQSMGYLVEALEAGRYLRRDPHDSDRRAQLIVRTRRGWRVNVVAKRAVAAVEGEWAGLLGQRRMTVFKRTLARIAELLGEAYEGSVSEVSSRRPPGRHDVGLKRSKR